MFFILVFLCGLCVFCGKCLQQVLQKFENWLLVTVTMERADRVGGKDGNMVALLQNMECLDVHKKMSAWFPCSSVGTNMVYVPTLEHGNE